MKKLLLFVCFLTFLEGNSQTIHRVTIGMNLQTEIDNATAGDIFMVEAGSYGNISISKKIVLIGTGYILTQSATPGVAVLGKVKFLPGSEGSWITGFKTGDINISASNIMILRNYAEQIQLGINVAESNWTATADNCTIKQNICRIFLAAAISPSHVNGFSFKNNIVFQGFVLQDQSIYGEIINNTFDADLIGDEISGLQFYKSFAYTNGLTCGKLNIVFKNNIMTNISNNGYCPITNYPPDIFINNVLRGIDITQIYTVPANLGTTNKILTATEPNLLYQGYPVNTNNLPIDARNQLAPNSPAKGAGEGGTDAGAFGGDEPFVLSGIPFVPTIYELKVPQTTSQGGTLNVQIKAKTNN